MTVRPYPWASLDSVARGDVALLRDLARWLGGAGATHAAAASLASQTGVAADVRLRALEPIATPADDDAVAVAIALDAGGASGKAASAVVEVESALALHVVSRVAGRPLRSGAGAAPTDARAKSAAAQALGALVVRALRRARGDADPSATSAGAANAVLAAAAIPDPCAAIYMVLLDDDAYRARVIVSRRAVAASAGAPPTRAALERLGPLSLRVPVVAAASWATAAELEALRPGDAWMPGRLSLAPGARWLLSGAHVERGLAATLEGGGRLVLGNSVEDLAMNDAADQTLLDSALDAPVVVRVEVGAVQLSAREWASLKAGDVVTLEQRVGAPVVLRAGGAELATGELVDVDGEIGVRIVSISSSPSS